MSLSADVVAEGMFVYTEPSDAKQTKVQGPW